MPIYLALGANQKSVFSGQSYAPSETFRLVFNEMTRSGIEVLKMSGVWESPAWPDPHAQPPYKNAVIEVQTDKEPEALLQVLKTFEYAFGRREDVRNAPRPLDLDILDYNGALWDRPGLKLPHPRMCERAFVLLPLSEIAPIWKDPIENRAIYEWIARLELSDIKPLKRLGKIL